MSNQKNESSRTIDEEFAVENTLRTLGIEVVSVRKRQFQENVFVFETDMLSHKQIEQISKVFELGTITPEHNFGRKRSPLDDIRLRVDVIPRD